MSEREKKEEAVLAQKLRRDRRCERDVWRCSSCVATACAQCFPCLWTAFPVSIVPTAAPPHPSSPASYSCRWRSGG
eukprot:2657375-Rhodomonas_salina.3